ncbi:FG-GAP-like repeat-containing protein [Phyllobacterium phragmitis]
MPSAAIATATALGRQALIQLDQAAQQVNVYFFREDGTVSTTPSQSTNLRSVFGDKGDLFHPGQNGYRWDTVADVTGDGIADLIYSRAGDDDIRTITGTADGTFDTRQVKVTDVSDVNGTWTGGGEGASYSTFLADVTHDDILDWVHGRSDGLSVYKGKGDGTFSEKAVTTAGFSNTNWAAGGDSYLGEIAGRPVWVSYDDLTYTLNVYEFEDNGTLSTKPIVTDMDRVTPDDAMIYTPHNSLKGSSFLVDVTGDKIPDLVFSVDDWWETLEGERYPVKGIAVMTGKSDKTFDYAYTFTDMNELGSVGNWAGGTTKDVNGLHSTFLEDVNGDGKLDWIHTGTSHGVRAFLGNGDGTFSNIPVESAVAGRWSWGSTVVADVGSVNEISSGKQALIQLDQTAQKVDIYFFEPDGTVTATPSRSTDLSGVFGDKGDLFHPGQNGYRWDTVADVTGDGIGDLVYSRAGDREIRVILGKADGTFDTSQVKVTDMSHFGGTWTGGGEGASYSTFLADVTHDGILDWVHGTSGALSVYNGKGDGTFSERAITTTGFSNANWATGGNVISERWAIEVLSGSRSIM